jgi:hypothetical protein
MPLQIDAAEVAHFGPLCWVRLSTNLQHGRKRQVPPKVGALLLPKWNQNSINLDVKLRCRGVNARRQRVNVVSWTISVPEPGESVGKHAMQLVSAQMR